MLTYSLQGDFLNLKDKYEHMSKINMVRATLVDHHKHIRKRVHQNLEEYPHPDRLKNSVDKLVYIAGFFGLAMTIPQVAKIWIGQNASGVAVESWISYLFIGIVMIAYGILHKEKPLIVTYTCWIIFYVLIIVGTLFYG